MKGDLAENRGGPAHSMNKPLIDRHVIGSPAAFATTGERTWRLTLESNLLDSIPDGRGRYLELQFKVAARPGYPLGPDLDNLCEPVFSVVTNRLGWFGGRRPYAQGWRARKEAGTPTGCQVRITPERWEGSWLAGTVILNATFEGRLPTSARDRTFARWAATTGIRRAATSTVGIALEFGGAVNLGDIATGRVKSVIDCLWPVIGGTEGRPADGGVTALEVARTFGLASDELHVRVVELAS